MALDALVLLGLFWMGMATGSEKLPVSTKQELCMIENLYHEARGELYDGMNAVLHVVMNRVHSSKFPNTICEVTKQAKLWDGHPIRDKCQFSWYCDGKDDRMSATIPRIVSEYVVHHFFKGTYKHDITDGAMWYHADNIEPWWASHYTKTVHIGGHIFYKENNNG